MLAGKVGSLLVQPIGAPTGLASSQRGNLVVGSVLPVRDAHAGLAGGVSTSSLKF
jgi:hypothetical protein